MDELPAVTFEEFKKIDIRVGRVLEVQDHPNADRLYVLKVDMGGGEVRQIVAGIRSSYSHDAVIHRNIVVIRNLAPRNIRGVESQGMLLAAHGADSVVFLSPEKEVPPGASVS